MDLLQGRVAEPAPAPAPLPEPEEAVSLEALEPDRAEEHDRFHKEYVEPPPPVPGRRRAESYRRARLELSRKGLRQAFIMKEVLGPPKGLDGEQ
jgi:hypothetical protein